VRTEEERLKEGAGVADVTDDDAVRGGAHLTSLGTPSPDSLVPRITLRKAVH